MKRKILTMLLSGLLCLNLTACSNEELKVDIDSLEKLDSYSEAELEQEVMTLLNIPEEKTEQIEVTEETEESVEETTESIMETEETEKEIIETAVEKDKKEETEEKTEQFEVTEETEESVEETTESIMETEETEKETIETTIEKDKKEEKTDNIQPNKTENTSNNNVQNTTQVAQVDQSTCNHNWVLSHCDMALYSFHCGPHNETYVCSICNLAEGRIIDEPHTVAKELSCPAGHNCEGLYELYCSGCNCGLGFETIPGESCYDNNGDYYCDVCGNGFEHNHVDNDSNCECDICGQEFGHVPGEQVEYFSQGEYRIGYLCSKCGNPCQ